MWILLGAVLALGFCMVVGTVELRRTGGPHMDNTEVRLTGVKNRMADSRRQLAAQAAADVDGVYADARRRMEEQSRAVRYELTED